MSPKLAQAAKAVDAELVVGDASRTAILNEAGLPTARALVVAINDPGATARVVSRARDARPDVFILARTRFVSEIEPLYDAGANLVIPEEFETSIEIAAHLLKQMDIPDNIVEGQIAAIRAGGYGMLRGKPVDRAFTEELMAVLQSTVTRTHYVAQNSIADGKTLAQLDLRAKTGVTIIAVVRNGKPTTNPTADFHIRHEDVLVLVGGHAQLDAAKNFLNQPSV
jgi:CPA2 family monovalent cation:H+ antiporter-2